MRVLGVSAVAGVRVLGLVAGAVLGGWVGAWGCPVRVLLLVLLLLVRVFCRILRVRVLGSVGVGKFFCAWVARGEEAGAVGFEGFGAGVLVALGVGAGIGVGPWVLGFVVVVFEEVVHLLVDDGVHVAGDGFCGGGFVEDFFVEEDVEIIFLESGFQNF